MVVIRMVSLLLVLSFSIPVVMSTSNSFSTNSTATKNCKRYQRTAYQRSKLKATGLKEYFKRFQEILIPTRLKEYFKWVQCSLLSTLIVSQIHGTSQVSVKFQTSDFFGLALCFDISDLLHNLLRWIFTKR